MNTPAPADRLIRAQDSTTAREQQVEGHLQLTPDREKITHLVCCRDASWRTAFCGTPGHAINLAAEIICAMCLETAEAMHPGWLSNGMGYVCPVDGNPCPDDHEVDLRIARETDPTA
ncbi:MULTISPECIES: hypothetical protein [Kitasatospora]|uniref:Uncharacterized protein n=1 Tax=Kitasatospora cystarginea TaxID=58350 RepID=A0ABN3ETM0_9ACTN